MCRILWYTDVADQLVLPEQPVFSRGKQASISVAAHCGYLLLNVQLERSEFSLILKGLFPEKSDSLGNSPDHHPNLFGAQDQLQPWLRVSQARERALPTVGCPEDLLPSP